MFREGKTTARGAEPLRLPWTAYSSKCFRLVCGTQSDSDVSFWATTWLISLLMLPSQCMLARLILRTV